MTDDPLIIVIDDEREIPSDVPVLYLKNSEDGLAELVRRHEEGVDTFMLWLDHDLGWDDDIKPVVRWLEEQGFNGTPFQVDAIMVHTANPAAALWMVAGLRKYYDVSQQDFPWVEDFHER